MGFSRKKRNEPNVDLTPMVDVVFLLLIFFMISTTFVETPGLSIKLPETSSVVAERDPDEVKVYLSREGEVFIKDKPYTLEVLPDYLRSFGPRAQGMTFMLLADKEARHGVVVELMDMAQTAGFSKLAIATREKGGR